MATKKPSKPIKAVAGSNARDLMKIGDRVRIPQYGGQRGRIVEYRGPLGPGGAHIYRVLVHSKPKRTYIELREDQLELIQVNS